MIAYLLGFWPQQSVYGTDMDPTMLYETCPACSAKRRNRTIQPNVFECRRCSALYGTCYLGDSYGLVKPFFATEPVPTERCRYFDFTTIGSAGSTGVTAGSMSRAGAWCRSADYEARLLTRTETAMTTLSTNNEAWGFWGTMRHHAEPAEAWPIAMQAIGRATGCAEFAVRDFLDSRHGRHFADDVAGGLFKGLSLPVAIDAAVDRWMNWTVNRRASRETGIPRGLSYLLGLVADCQIRSEAA